MADILITQKKGTREYSGADTIYYDESCASQIAYFKYNCDNQYNYDKYDASITDKARLKEFYGI